MTSTFIVVISFRTICRGMTHLLASWYYHTTDGPTWQSGEAGRAGYSPQCLCASVFKRPILCLCGAFPASLLWGDPACYRHSPRAESLLIHRIQSHTHPKRRKFCLKHAGQKSSKEELPKQRKGPKRAVECQLKVQTHIWEQDAGSSSLPTRTNKYRKTAYLGGFSVFID